MSSKLSKLVLLIIGISLAFSSGTFAQKKKKYVVNGYVGGYGGRPIKVELIDANKLTHINYAFVNCIDSMAVLTNMRSDTINFRLLNTLKKTNPDLKIMISVGGWTWSKNFSDAVLTPTSRALFARTSVDIVRKYNLDGVDIDWEYPNSRGAGNKFRPEDKQNFTLMFRDIRKELDKLAAETGKKYQMTAAVGGSKGFINNTEMYEVGKLLDYVFIMTYDYSGPGGTVGHHTNLYSYGPNGTGSSAEQSVRDFIAAGVPANKIGLGAAFYGKGVVAATTANNGLQEKRVTAAAPGETLPRLQSGDYTWLKDSLINKKGYVRHWDKKAQAPYLFNPQNKLFVTYEDEKSIKLKCKFVKKHKLAGIFFWEYFDDPKKYLITEISKNLN